MPFSRIRCAPVKNIFRYTSDDEKKIRVQFARMCVLYEDLRIEFEGAQAEKIEALDHTSVHTRRFYFVRRTLATLTEIAGAIHILNCSKMFRKSMQWVPPEHLKVWNQAVKFFGHQMRHDFLHDWRNDVGGHFLQQAAEYAIDNIHESTIGTIEIYARGRGADIMMPFAYELVAMALTKKKDQHQTEEQFIEQAFTFLAEAFTHASNAIQVVAGPHIIDRLR